MNPTVSLPEIEVTAACHDCRRKHVYRVRRADLSAAMGEWLTKHANHAIHFSTPRPLYEGPWRKWLREFWSECPLWRPAGYAYGHNADAKLAYVASAAYTITLASLASDTNLLAGRESTAVSNATNKYLDYLIAGQVTTGTSPTTNRTIQPLVYAALNDTPTYPDVFDGTDSAETITSAGIKNSALVPLRPAGTDNTSDRAYPFAPSSLAELFGGLAVPTHHGLFVTHDTAQNLNATGGNHFWSYTPVYGTVA